MQFSLLPDFLRSKTDDPLLDKVSDLIDDEYIDDFLADCYPHYSKNVGRPPYWPSSIIRMHLLFFLKGIPSFNKLSEAVKQTPAYMKFCGFVSKEEVPSPGQLSQFRKRVGEKKIKHILSKYMKYFSSKIDPETLPAVVVLIDSTPVETYSSEKKRKRCDHTEPCNCPETRSDPDARTGWRKPDKYRKEFFLGYRKHSVYLLHPDTEYRLPLYSEIHPANVPDIEILEPLLDKVVNIFPFKIDYALVDQGYYDFDLFNKIQKEKGISIHVKPKKNIKVNIPVDSNKIPICPEGHTLEWVEFDKDELEHTYRCPFSNPETQCIRASTCDGQFQIPMSENPVLFSAIPHHSWISRRFYRLRKRIETEFGILINSFLIDRLKFRGLPSYRFMFTMADLAFLFKRVSQWDDEIVNRPHSIYSSLT
ncbi:MAG: transposase [Methanosarcinales archaeon]